MSGVVALVDIGIRSAKKNAKIYSFVGTNVNQTVLKFVRHVRKLVKRLVAILDVDMLLSKEEIRKSFVNRQTLAIKRKTKADFAETHVHLVLNLV